VAGSRENTITAAIATDRSRFFKLLLFISLLLLAHLTACSSLLFLAHLAAYVSHLTDASGAKFVSGCRKE
jgi:hypothetical protein